VRAPEWPALRGETIFTEYRPAARSHVTTGENVMAIATPTNPIGANRLFEYLVADIQVDLLDISPVGVAVQSLNDLGAHGWELLSVLQTMQRDHVVGFFRRDLLAATAPLPVGVVPGE
jgi:hypothetical protein